MSGLLRRAVERLWGWRTWCFGPPTREYACTVAVSTGVDWQHFGASVDWVSDGDGRYADLWLGPLALHVMAAPSARASRRAAAGWERPKSTVVRRQVGGRTVSTWRNWRHVGLSVDWGRLSGGMAVKVTAGPFGVLVEPAYRTAPAT